MNTQYIHRLFTTLAIALLAVVTALAQEFTVDGINYQVTSTENKEVRVIGGDTKETISFPPTVTYENIEYTVTCIGSYAFSDRNDPSNFVRKYVIPGTVNTIEAYAFSGNTFLEEIDFNEGLQTIGVRAFSYDISLNSIIIPSTVTSIDWYAFWSDYRPKPMDVVCKAMTPPAMEGSAVDGFREGTTLFVPSGAIDAYRNANGWNSFTDIQGYTTEPVVRPQFSLDYENYLLSITSSTDGSTIYYTTDGTEPSSSSSLYSAPIVFVKNGTVKAMAVHDGMADSKIGVYTSDFQVAEPTSLIDNETLEITFSVSDIKDIEGFPETKIYYIADDWGDWGYHTIAEGRTDWVLWDGNPIPLTVPKWYHAYAVREGWKDSGTSYRVDYLSNYSTARPRAEWIKEKSKLRLYDYDADATVYYTLDGSDPTKDSYVYNPDDSIFVDHNLTVKWIAMRPHHCNSEMGVAEITDATSKFVRNGIAYRRIDNNVANEVEVTSKLNESSKYAGHIEIPEEIQWNNTTYTVTRIGDHAFSSCPNLTGVTIPTTVTSIGVGAFYDCDAMTQIEIPSSVEKIVGFAFYDCNNLKDVFLHDGLREIGYQAFSNDGALKQITLPETVEEIGEEAFSNAGLNGTIIIPDAVTSIRNRVFVNCTALKSVVMGDGITSIGEGAFRYCYSLESVTFGSALTTVGYEAFYQCSSLLSIELKEGVKSIDTRAFYECGKLSTVSLPQTLTTIGDYAFERCSSLPTIQIPEGVKSIGRRAFQGCSSLKSAYLMPATPPSLVSDDSGHAFYDQLISMVLYVKSADKDAYEGNVMWCQIENIQALGSTPSAQPAFTLDRNSYELTISSRDANAAIYYTRDNSEPTEQSTRYTAPIAFMQNDTVKAIAVSDGLAPSQVSEFKKNDFMVPVPVPTMDENYVVTIDCETPQLAGFPETKIYYIINTDGYQWYETIAQGRNDWQLYEGPIQLSQPRYVHAYAVRDGWIDSERTIADYSSNYYTNTPWSEWVSDKNKLRLYNYDEDATVYYTLDGSDPTENSYVYNPQDSIFIDHNLTVKWVAMRANHFNSEIGSYTITDATSTFVVGDLSYRRIDNNPALEVEVTANPVGKVYSGDVTVPSEIKLAGTTYQVTRIGEGAFYNCSELTSIDLPTTINSIGRNAFYGARLLKKIEFKGAKISLDYGAFEECYQLKEVIFHGQLIKMDPRAFAYCRALESITIPDGFTRIEGSSFYSNTSLKSISIPEGVVYIGEHTFDGCSSLTTIQLPSTLQKVDHWAFMNSAIQSIVIPDNVTFMGNEVFRDCYSLNSVTLPASLETLGDYAFYRCNNLRSISLPEGFTTINYHTFYECTGLTTVQLPSTLTTIGNSAFKDCSALRTITLPESVKKIDEYAFSGCSALESIYALPTTPPTVSSGAAFAFAQQISSAPLYVKPEAKDAYNNHTVWAQFSTIEGITQIPTGQPTFVFDGANYKLSIVSQDANAAIYYTRDNSEPTELSTRYTEPIAFMQNDTVKAIAISEGLAPSLVSEFRKNDFKVPTPTAEINDETFVVTVSCETPEIEGFPETKFYYCLNDNYYNIDYNDEAWQLLEGNTIELTEPRYLHLYAVRDGWVTSEQTYFDYYSNYRLYQPQIYYNSSDHTVTLTHYNDVPSEFYYTLDGSEPSKDNGTLYTEPFVVDRNYKVRAVAVMDKHFNSSVAEYVIDGVSTTFLADGIYYRLRDMTTNDEVEVCGVPEGIANYSGDITINPTVTYNNKVYTVTGIYNSAFSGSSIKSISLPEGLQVIRGHAFNSCQSLTEIEIPSTVEELGSHVFYNCYKLNKLTLHDGLKTIREYAFAYCTQLTNVTLPNTVTLIEHNTFYGCSGLTAITWPASVNTIEDNMFDGCEKLTNVTLPATLTAIKHAAFYNCRSLLKITLPESLTTIGYEAFRGCRALTSIVIPNGVKTIESSTFSYCESLVSVLLPAQLETIGSEAFYNCPNLASITLPATLKTIGSNAFGACGSLSSIYSQPSTAPEAVNGGGLESHYEVATLYVQPASKQAYQTAPYWSQFKTISEFTKIAAEQPAFVFQDYKLSLSTITAGGAIYYTRDGSNPTTQSLRYTEPLIFTQNDTVKAITVAENMENSRIAEFRKNDFKVAQPQSTLDEETFKVTITCETPEAEGMPETRIWYAINQSYYTPEASQFKLYDGEPIQMTKPGYIHLYAERDGWETSDRRYDNFYDNYRLDEPYLSWNSEQKLMTITQSNADAIYYTIDGSEPSKENGTLYTEPFTLPRNLIVKAVAVKDKHFNSNIREYTVSGIDASFMVDGIMYRLVDNTLENVVEVTTGSEIKEVIDIPETIDHNDVQYTVVGIRNSAFSGRSDNSNFTRKYVIPKTVKSIGDRAFYDNYYVEEIELNEGLETIGYYAFGFNFSLSEIYIPSTVVSMGDYAFYNDSWRNNDLNIYCCAKTPEIQSNTFGGRREASTLFVYENYLDNFKSADYWKDFAKIETFSKVPVAKPRFSFDMAKFKLAITTPTNGATIYYTRDGSDPTTNSLVYTDSIILTQNDTVRAIAVKDGMGNSLITEFKKSDFKVAAPVATIDSETFQVTITCENSDVEGMPETRIWYVIDQSYYNRSDGFTLYDGEPIQMTEPGYIHMYAERDGWIMSDQRYDNFYSDYRLTTPSISWDSETKTFTLTHDDNEVSFYYTLDGSEPTKGNGLLYSEPVTLVRNLVIKAIATKDAHFNSAVREYTVTGVDSRFLYNGLAYRLVDNTTEDVVEVTSGGNVSGKVTIPETVEDLNGKKFTVVRIGDSAFSGENDITEVVLPETISSIGEYAFNECRELTNINLPDALTDMGRSAFYRTNLKEIVVPGGLKKLPDAAFMDNFNTKSVIIKPGVEEIDHAAFAYCGMQSLELPATLKKIGFVAFQNCASLVSVSIPDAVVELDNSAFYECTKLATVSLSSSLTRIGNSAFNGCSSLVMIIFPETLEKIEDNAFANCVSLNHVYSQAANPPTIETGSSPFTDVVEHATLYVKPQSEAIYSQTPNWGAFSKIETFENLPCEKPVFAYDNYHLTMTSETEGVNIYYTLDGTEPTTSSLLYKEPIAIAKNDTILAMAISDDWGRSLTSEWRKNDLQVANPVASISDDLTVTVTCEEPEVEGLPQTRIYYSLNRSSWDGGAEEDWKLYTEPLKLTVANYMHVRAERDGWIKSGQSDFNYYTDYYLDRPSLSSNSYMPEDSTITITHSNPNAQLYYTLDGSDPNETGILYTGPFNPDRNVKVTAIAKCKGHINSDPEVREYNWFKVKTPRITFNGKYVIIETETPGTTIYYTTDNTEPDTKSKVYQKPFALPAEQTIVKTIAVRENWNNSSVMERTYNPGLNYCENPVIARVAGTNKVQMTTRTSGAKIYYTSDGLNPTINSAVYAEEVVLTENCTLKAMAADSLLYDSDVTTFAVDWFKVDQPVIAADGIFLTITAPKEGSKIYYTLDGSEPTTGSTLYEGTLTMKGSCTIKAMATYENFNNSSVAVFNYYSSEYTCGLPSFSREGNKVSIASAPAEGTTIYYTTDGTTPTTASSVFTEPIEVEQNITIKALATNDKLFTSEVADYEVNWFKVETPVIAFDGIFATITCSTPNSRIYYTLDGSSPTAESLYYTDAITMTASCTVKAIAMRDNFNNSAVMSVSFDKASNTISTPQFVRNGNEVTVKVTQTEGTTIYYTLDGTTPTTESTVYTTPVQVVENGTLKAMATNPKLFTSEVATYDVDWFKVTTPVLTLNGNTLTMSCTTPDAVIYYEYDEAPTEKSAVYSGPITLVDNRMVFAVAVKNNFHDSEVAMTSPDMFVCTQPTFDYNGRYLQIETGENMDVHYTLDGSKPTEDSEVYDGQIEIKELCTVRAIAMRRDFRDSPEASYTVSYVYTGEDASQTEAGHLADMFEWVGGTDNVENLPVSGKINAADIEFIRSLKSLRHLDLTDAVCEGNVLPDEAFANMPLLTFQSPKQLSAVGNHLFSGCDQLAAIVWNANIAIPETVTEDVKGNANFLLYVNSRIHVPSSYTGNIISGGQATSITLTDAGSGNFCCPQRFFTNRISYTHTYSQTTESGVTCGWETLALPFDVQSITHERRGAMAPFSAQEDYSLYKPFWLYELQETGFSDATEVKAYTPYIISMPNNPNYADDFILAGKVTFSAADTYIEVDTAMVTMKGSVRFAPAMQRQEKSSTVLAINLEDCTVDGTFYRSGSAFLPNLRTVNPFEAYALVGASVPKIPLVDMEWGYVTDMRNAQMSELEAIGRKGGVYDLLGRKLSNDSSNLKNDGGKMKRVYIINGKKVVVE